MKLDREVLMKSFGNGVAMLRFQQDQTPDSVGPFIANLGMSAMEFVIGKPATDVYIMMEEGHPVTGGEARNTDDDWDALVDTVDSQGSEAFCRRVANLAVDRKSLLPPALAV